MHRSSRPEVSCKKGVLGNFAKFTGQHLCQNLFFNKVVGLRPANLLKKRLWHSCFPVNFAEFLRTPFLTEHHRWLLLNAKVFTCKILIATKKRSFVWETSSFPSYQELHFYLMENHCPV